MSEREARDHAHICKPVISPRIVSKQKFKDFKPFQSCGKQKVGDYSATDYASSRKVQNSSLMNMKTLISSLMIFIMKQGFI